MKTFTIEITNAEWEVIVKEANKMLDKETDPELKEEFKSMSNAEILESWVLTANVHSVKEMNTEVKSHYKEV